MYEALAQHQSDLAVEFRRLHDWFSVRNGKSVIARQVATAKFAICARNFHLATLSLFLAKLS
jgi:hypothetical protein